MTALRRTRVTHSDEGFGAVIFGLLQAIVWPAYAVDRPFVVVAT